MKRNALSSDSIAISSTEIQNNLVMHIQERNVHNKIFGGFLMREMIESGWIAGKVFVKDNIISLEDITNIYFRKAVEIGARLKIISRITYTEKNIIAVTVEAYAMDLSSESEELSCKLLIFMKTEKWQKKVVPHTYE